MIRRRASPNLFEQLGTQNFLPQIVIRTASGGTSEDYWQQKSGLQNAA